LETQQRREGGGGEETVAKESGGGGARVARTMVGDKLASMMTAALKIELGFEILEGFIDDSLEEIGKRGRQRLAVVVPPRSRTAGRAGGDRVDRCEKRLRRGGRRRRGRRRRGALGSFRILPLKYRSRYHSQTRQAISFCLPRSPAHRLPPLPEH
jgi:hypothetical protein